MQVIIRKTDRNEFHQTENLTRETFWNLYNPGCTEHLVLHNLRNSKSYVEDLDLVIICQREIIGHIILTKAKIVDNKNKEHEVLCVGPFVVSIDFQNQGIGTKLLNYSIIEAKKIGFKGMILFGNPDYYHRFGFKDAKVHKVTTKDGQNFAPFMAIELQTKGFDNIQGRFFEDKAFEINEEELSKFEERFPAKEKGKPKIEINN